MDPNLRPDIIATFSKLVYKPICYQEGQHGNLGRSETRVHALEQTDATSGEITR